MARKSQNNEDPEEEQMEVDAGRNINFDSDEEGGLRIDEEIYIPPPPKPIDKVDVNGPRLIITKIVNENFKSYAGKQVVGPFHKCFSAIVGPNGSGKSNVIDSMLFVFGYRASKIRLKKISGLIHDSKEHSGIKSCNVSVHFQQIVDKAGSDYDIIPNSEFIISRTAFKDSSSFYQLNGKKVQFKEVAKLLRSHGVDLDHNRFLILQGEVEQIALMKPKGQNEHDTGMLEYLEDIIGTARYKEPLEKLSEKVEILTERRVEKLNRLRIVEKEKADLEEPMQEAVAYLKLENTITKLLHQSYHIKRLEVKRELVERETEKESVDKDLSDLVEQMNVVRREKEEKNTELKEKCKKWDKIQQKKDKATEQYEKIRKKDDALFAELVETNKRRKANMASVKSERAKVEELARVPDKNAKDIEECEKLTEKHVAEREREEAALATLMSGLREKTEPLLKKRTKLETELISLRKNVDEAKATFDIAESELQLHTSVEEKEKAKLEELRESLKVTVEKLTERKQQLASFDAKIPRTRASLQQAQQELDEVKKQEAEAGTRLRAMRVRVEEQRSTMQASRSRNRVLDSLMQQKREGNIPGILGRLGDLGAIDAKYDVAISTACGPLDNIVVDTANTAKTCIAFLRERDIGRATFIPLEKQQRFVEKCNQKISTPENVPRLFDLIKVEDRRVLPAFYYGLQNTLVANDLDQATRIAYGAQRYRVVTLNGELIELSGTMSGGGRTVVKGRMGQSVVRSEPSAADVDKLQKDLDIVYEECNRLKAAQQPLENQVQTLSTALNAMTVDKEKYTIEMRALKEQEPGLRSQLKVQEDKAAKAVCDPAQIEKLTTAVENARKNMEKAELDAKSITDKVAILNREIDELSGNRVKVQQTKIANISKAIEKAKAEVIRLQVGIKTAERNTKKAEQHIETLESDVEKCKEKLRSLQQEKTDLEQIAKGLMAELSEATEALVERDEAMGSLKEQINALHTRETKMKALKIDLDQKISDFNKALKELKQRGEDYTQRIAALKLRDIPNQAREELKELTEHETVELDGDVVATNLRHVKERLPSELPNMQLIKDYQEKDALYLRRGAELEAITNERNDLRKTYETARRRRYEEFIAGFSMITGKLKEMYQMITLGGDAELELVDSLDPFSEGIVFSVRPPKKSWKNISNLSGGEKTLSSLALVFALHHFKPTPLYFMDEIDAALDFKNVSIVGNYIKERTKNAQFIVISLRSNMFELADYLVGIYKTFNCTKCAFVDLGKFYEKHGPPPEAQVANSLKRYASQQQKLLTQQVAPRPRDNNQQSMPVTCPAQLQHERTPTPTTRDATFQLPELDLCPTPTRASNAPTEMSETVQNETEEIVENSPMRKRRKI